MTQVCLYQSVPELVAEHIENVFRSLMVDKIASLVRHEVMAAFASVEDESPAAMTLKGANISAVTALLAMVFTSETVQAALIPLSRVIAVSVFHLLLLMQSAPHSGSI